jgi:hypothetical protein
LISVAGRDPLYLPVIHFAPDRAFQEKHQRQDFEEVIAENFNDDNDR